MRVYGAYLKTADGNIHFNGMTLKSELFENVNIVSVFGSTDAYLDCDTAARKRGIYPPPTSRI